MNHDGDAPGADDLSVWLEQSNDLLATTDTAGQLVWSNGAFRKATGWDGSQGRSLLTFLAPGTAGEDDRATLLRGLREGIAAAAELCLQSGDGKPVWLLARAAHNAGRVLWTLRDITA
jgi:PAS domain-containing protein